MTKRALVAGVNDYRNWHSQGFPDLGFCRADADAFAQLLVDAFGFDAGNVTVLQDSAASSDAITGTISALIGNSQAGDVVCVYFSGHGDQEDAGDGSYIHTFVPYSGTMISNNTIAAIAASLAPSQINLTLVLDSCFSGGVYVPGQEASIRTRNWTQEMIDAFVSTCRLVCPLIGLPDISPLLDNISDPQGSNAGVTMSVDPTKDFADAAKATLLSACNYNETAGETPTLGHGYFTNAFLDIVNQSGFARDHPSLLQQLRQRVAGYGAAQTPQLRGRPVRLQENFLEGWNYSI
jgi:uncharacterized caspase-like protein